MKRSSIQANLYHVIASQHRVILFKQKLTYKSIIFFHWNPRDNTKFVRKLKIIQWWTHFVGQGDNI